MKLIYNDTHKEVRKGDRVYLDCQEVTIADIEKPRSPASTGRVYVNDGVEVAGYYPNIFNAYWIEREDV